MRWGVVCPGGRPDLARAALDAVATPTLLVVGGADELVLGLNRQVLERLRSPKQLAVIPRASHTFPEPGALEEVARLAAAWFKRLPRGLGPRLARGGRRAGAGARRPVPDGRHGPRMLKG